MNLRNKLVTANTKKNNIEYVTLENNMKVYKDEKKNHQKILLKIPKSDIVNNTAVKLLIQTAEEKYQEEKEKLKFIRKSLKSSKNEEICEWETNTPKEIRADAVNDVCKAYKTAKTNLKLGHIKKFTLGFRKKKDERKCLLLPLSFIKNNDVKLSIIPSLLKNESKFTLEKKKMKKHRNLVIEHDCRLVKQKNIFWIIIPIPVEITEKRPPINYCGIDPGTKTFMTCFGNNGCIEYKHNDKTLQKLNKKVSN